MASTATSFAFAAPSGQFGLLEGGTPTQFLLCIQVLAGDGVSAPLTFAEEFTYDASQPFATNIANMKTCVVSGAASFGITLTSDQVSVFAAVD